jgi:hypothetical protein
MTDRSARWVLDSRGGFVLFLKMIMRSADPAIAPIANRVVVSAGRVLSLALTVALRGPTMSG